MEIVLIVIADTFPSAGISPCILDADIYNAEENIFASSRLLIRRSVKLISV
jgi:hypothetical protein